MERAEQELGLGVVVVGGLLEPLGRLPVILGDAATVLIELAESGLGLGAAVLGGDPKMPRRGLEVPGAAGLVHDAEIVVGDGASLIGGLPKPGDGRHLILWDAVAQGIQVAEIDLRLGVALSGPDPPQAQRRGVIAIGIGLLGGNLLLLAKRRRLEQCRHDQDQGGCQRDPHG